MGTFVDLAGGGGQGQDDHRRLGGRVSRAGRRRVAIEPEGGALRRLDEQRERGVQGREPAGGLAGCEMAGR
ncbi:hypothetical protein EBL84_09340 [Marichromatium sp. AB31]|nr:hypothetical protein [Marichromatium gracile]RNE89879.1 hypothetical protein EBL84_09340 [Marichromatium sp. AB31]